RRGRSSRLFVRAGRRTIRAPAQLQRHDDRMTKPATTSLAILGAGKIGRMVCHMLATSGLYQVRIGDMSKAAIEVVASRYPQLRSEVVDFVSAQSLDAFLAGSWGVISCAPFHCNPLIAQRARQLGLHYFDLTEDVEVTQRVKELADGSKTA